MHLSQHVQRYLKNRHFQQQNLSTSHQLLNPPPLAMPIPRHPTIFRDNATRQALKLTILLVNIVADGSMNVPKLSGCSAGPVTRKRRLSKVLFLNIGVTRGWPKATLRTFLPPRSLLWGPETFTVRGHPLCDSRPTATPFLTQAVPNKLRKS